MITRREFLKTSLAGAAGAAISLAAIEMVDPGKVLAAAVQPEKNARWAFLIDSTKCVGCGLCVKACKLENGLPFEANISPTWVERYILTNGGELFADSPKAGRDGYTSKRVDLGMGKYQVVDKSDTKKAFFVPKLCNHCENPPCVQVCPVGATYRTPDGVVLVDKSWCIGCGYCIMACPYGARFIDPRTRTAGKCTFCYHRITKGLKTACVQACPFGARQFGNLNDPNDPVAKTIMTQRVVVLKDEYGTKPQAYYLGLSKEVR
ncbi:MAG: 4Fe-4S dicluster domain-containing protein [Bacteroidetes bacterium]|nr:4Fe-4S dicluster domain-containing protein [Bacteroidota bacterium]MCL5024927.1 4Fe-4S dicluster domain-containing protein [Chloroflexota bacterium]